MTVQERNDLISKCISEYKDIHDKYFPRGGALSDSDWETYIRDMDGVAEKYKDTGVKNISAKLCMVFLDDVEEYHKKWKAYKNE